MPLGTGGGCLTKVLTLDWYTPWVNDIIIIIYIYIGIANYIGIAGVPSLVSKSHGKELVIWSPSQQIKKAGGSEGQVLRVWKWFTKTAEIGVCHVAKPL